MIRTEQMTELEDVKEAIKDKEVQFLILVENEIELTIWDDSMEFFIGDHMTRWNEVKDCIAVWKELP